MENLIALNNKKIKRINKVLTEQYGLKEDFLKSYALFLKKKDNSIKLITRDVVKINDHKINIDSMGLRIGKEIADGILLSIEGSQIMGPFCSKNIVQISREDAKLWLKGNDIHTQYEQGFVILKYENDFLGTGKVKANRIINNVPKTRRLKCSD
ncbi:MAG: methyltransferase RsmF C-terminal domain-like protein [Nanobdellota archaeon]